MKGAGIPAEDMLGWVALEEKAAEKSRRWGRAYKMLGLKKGFLDRLEHRTRVLATMSGWGTESKFLGVLGFIE